MKHVAVVFIIFVAGIITISACGSGQIFGPTLTPTSTDTLTPTATIATETPTPTATIATEAPTPTNTLTPSPTPVQLGGTEVAYAWDTYSYKGKISLPKGVTDIISNPTNPDYWKQPTGIFYSDGTPYLWGTSFISKGAGPYDIQNIGISVLVRGVFEIRNPVAYVGGTIILPVFEIPAEGGSNFLVPFMQSNRWSTIPNCGLYSLSTKDTIPSEWASSFDKPVDVNVFEKGTVFTSLYDEKDIGDLLKKQVGKIVFVYYQYEDNGEPYFVILKQIAQNQLIFINGESVVDTPLSFIGILPPFK